MTHTNITFKTLGNLEIDHPYFEKLDPFLDHFLNELTFHNTVQKALDAVLHTQNIDDNTYHIMFPNGIDDIYNSLIDFINFKTIIKFHSLEIKGVKGILKELILYQFTIYPNITTHLCKLLSKTLFKNNLCQHTNRFYSLIDVLWRLAGDQSTDYNYYSKRFLLGNIYFETMLYSISDTSDHYNDTEAFLVRNFDKIKYIEKYKAKLPAPESIQKNIIQFFANLRYGHS